MLAAKYLLCKEITYNKPLKWKFCCCNKWNLSRFRQYSLIVNRRDAD